MTGERSPLVWGGRGHSVGPDGRPDRLENAVNLRLVSASLLTLAAVAGPVAGCGSSNSGDAAKSGGSGNQSNQGGSSQSGSGGGGAGSVSIANFKFSPASLTVTKGTKVTVTNKDSTAHTFTADNGKSFDTGDINPNASATVSVAQSGTFKYHCSIHPFMHGTLIVK
jgi:plastocyanin